MSPDAFSKSGTYVFFSTKYIFKLLFETLLNVLVLNNFNLALPFSIFAKQKNKSQEELTCA